MAAITLGAQAALYSREWLTIITFGGVQEVALPAAAWLRAVEHKGRRQLTSRTLASGPLCAICFGGATGSFEQASAQQCHIRGECERAGIMPAILDTYISETYAQQNEDLIVEALSTPVLRRAGRRPTRAGLNFVLKIGI